MYDRFYETVNPTSISPIETFMGLPMWKIREFVKALNEWQYKIPILKQAIETYGADAQLNVAIEEFAELTKEICKHKRYADNTKAIIEEMADCYIMLEQMKMIFGLDNADVSNAMDRKISRLERRLSEKGGEQG